MTAPTKQAADRQHDGTDNDGTNNYAYRAMRTRLQAFIARRVESPQVAEDLTQEVLLRLVRSNTDELSDPAAWLYRVARNVITDHYLAWAADSITSLLPLAHEYGITLALGCSTFRRTRSWPATIPWSS